MNGVNFSLKAYHHEWSLAHAFLNQNFIAFLEENHHEWREFITESLPS